MKKNLLIIGKGDTDYNDRNPKRFFDNAKNNFFDVKRCDYEELKKLDNFHGDNLNVMLFFPYTFWNNHCERLDDDLLYGTSKKIYTSLDNFFNNFKFSLEKKFSDKNINYIINPLNATFDRDKIGVVESLLKNDISTTNIIRSRNLNEILDQVSEDSGVFIKCRYGAEGKGITVLYKDKWFTNYKVDENNLGNYGVYDKWVFSDITNRNDLVQSLLDNEVIVEKEIVNPNFYDGKKFDIRAYVINHEVPHFFVRFNDKEKIVTNYSQGAKILHNPDTGLRKDYVQNIKNLALDVANSLDSKFLGVDIMIDKDKVSRVVEVQTFTDFPDIHKFNLANYVFEKSNLFR